MISLKYWNKKLCSDSDFAALQNHRKFKANSLIFGIQWLKEGHSLVQANFPSPFWIELWRNVHLGRNGYTFFVCYMLRDI